MPQQTYIHNFFQNSDLNALREALQKNNYQQTYFDPTIREFKAKESFDLEHHAVNRADRRRIKAEYRKKKKGHL